MLAEAGKQCRMEANMSKRAYRKRMSDSMEAQGEASGKYSGRTEKGKIYRQKIRQDWKEFSKSAERLIV